MDLWKRAAKCNHENRTEHYRNGRCGTDYCDGWTETHCRDCGIFITACPCGSNNSFDGWSWKQRRAHRKAA